MIKRFYKKSDIQTYSPEKELSGHIFSFGRIGAGKSVSTKSIIEGFHDNMGFKIFDEYGGERDEGLYWALPSQDKEYFTDELGMLGELDEEGPKQYKVTFLYPYFKSKMPNKLPKKEGYVTSKIFTIPLQDITTEDIKMVCGNLSATSQSIWEEIQYKANAHDNAGSLQTLAEAAKGTNSIIYKNFILPMSREHLLMEKDCDYNIDLITEAKDYETITVLCLSYVPKKFHLLIINYFNRKLMELLDLNKLGRKKNNIIFIREASEFFRATEDSVLEERFKIFRSNLAFCMKMGRRGMYFACDCQSPAEVRGLLQGSEDFLLMFNTTSYRDKAEMTEELRKDKKMRPDQIVSLSSLESGECFISESPRNVKKYKISLPRSAYWKKEYGNFYRNVWEKFVGEWKNVNEIKSFIDNNVNAIIDKYKEKEKIEKDKIQELKDKKELAKKEKSLMLPEQIAPTEISIKNENKFELQPLP